MTTNVYASIIVAYCACARCTPGLGITASGTRPRQGVTVAVPRRVAFGSKVIIDGHAYVAEDRMARRFDGRFDIYFTRHSDAKKFGIRTNSVTVITP